MASMATPVCRNPQEEKEADDEAKTEEQPISPGLEHMMFYHILLLALENQKKKFPFVKTTTTQNQSVTTWQHYLYEVVQVPQFAHIADTMWFCHILKDFTEVF